MTTTLITIAFILVILIGFLTWILNRSKHQGKIEEENETLHGDVAGLKEISETLKKQRDSHASTKEEADIALQKIIKKKR